MHTQRQETFHVDGRAVDCDVFNAFLATLTEVPHTWYCAETTEGGDTGYDGTDAAGVGWTYVAATDAQGTRNTVVRTDRSGDGLALS
jgi:hypothetical protein